MTVLIIISVVIFLVLIAWMWQSLGNIETITKVGCIFAGLIGVYILTFIIYNISKIGITYDNVETMKTIRRVFVILFTILNGLIILPYIFKRLDKINNNETDSVNIKKSIIVLIVIIIVLFIFESIYFGNLQQGIINIINSK